MTEKKKILYIVAGAVGVIVLALVVLGGAGGTLPNLADITQSQSVSAQKSGSADKLVVHRDGRVEVHKNGQVFTDYWATGKTDAYFSYYDDQYGGSPSTTYDSDELIDSIINETSGGTSGGGNGDDEVPGNDIEDLFNTPTPTAGGQGGSSTPNPTSSTSPEDEPWCLYWRLSYCVIAYQTPAPSGVTSTPGPNILPPECPENQITGKTVIGDELCFTTPTPSPTATP